MTGFMQKIQQIISIYIPKKYKKRFMENIFRKVLNVKGSPIRLEFKSGENPFAGRVNRLTPRQKVKQDKEKREGGSRKRARPRMKSTKK